jgi:phosphate transport system protein
MVETRIRFHEALGTLKGLLIELGTKAEQTIDLAVEAYISRDAGACSQVLTMENDIDVAERRIDELAIELLASQQPIAVDLRFITACMKINADLERVGDHAADIARRGLADMRLPPVDLPVDLLRIAAAAAGMIRQALSAFIDKDVDLAYAVFKMDEVVDRMDDQTWISLVQRMHEAPEALDQALDALIVIRNLARVADHATNIAEDVIFWIRGTDVRHGIARVPPVEK